MAEGSLREPHYIVAANTIIPTTRPARDKYTLPRPIFRHTGAPMQVTPAIHALRHPFQVPVAPGIALDRFVYSYLIAGETITLIDTGVAGCETRIFEYIQSIGRDPSEISLIILTHSHPDHIGAARAIREATGCSVAAHPAERAWIEDVERQNRERPVPGFAGLVGGPVPLDFELDGGVTIDIDGTGEYEIEVMHTPGHSAGSISLFLPGNGALFSGDVVPVAGDLPVYDDVVGSVRSIRLLRGYGVSASSFQRGTNPGTKKPHTGRWTLHLNISGRSMQPLSLLPATARLILWNSPEKQSQHSGFPRRRSTRYLPGPLQQTSGPGTKTLCGVPSNNDAGDGRQIPHQLIRWILPSTVTFTGWGSDPT